MNESANLGSSPHHVDRGSARKPPSNGEAPGPEGELVVDATKLGSCIVDPSDFVADRSAFVDVRLPRSAGKASYSFIGPGVSQNPDQTVNITEPHGFNVGAASMPNGVVNNPHLHFTAEVFICTSGRWRFAVGERGEQSLDVGTGAIFSVPTWVFRGFENVGPDDGWLFTVLGRDDTGGILWAPWVLEEAAETGLYLSRHQTVLDAANGDSTDDVLAPLTGADLVHVDRYTDTELAARLVGRDALVWSTRAMLSVASGDDHRCSVAPVIGHGMSEDRRHRAPIFARHGFSIEWLRVDGGSSTGTHRHHRSQVLFVVDSGCELRLNQPDDRVSADVGAGSVVSVPAGAWRDIANTGDSPLDIAVVNGGDDPTILEWAPDVVEAARRAGWIRDANGFLAPTSLVGDGR